MNTSRHKASLKISKDVIETIASVAALEIDGVASLAEPHGNLQGFFKSRWNTQKIETVVTNGIAEISICLDLEMGAKISDVCYAVQQNVKENVQTMTGILVNRVNITVMGINIPKEEVEEELSETIVVAEDTGKRIEIE